MRYRPFGRSGVSVSALTLVLGDAATARGPQPCRDLVLSALEVGVNSFHLASDDPSLPQVVGETLLSVLERRMVFVSLALGRRRDGRHGLVRDFSPEALTYAVDHALARSGLGHLDLAVLDEPGVDEFPQRSLVALKALRSVGKVTLLGVAGDNEAMDAYLSTHAFDVLATPFSLTSGWRQRNRVKAAIEQDMAVVAYGWYPKEVASPRTIRDAYDRTAETKRGLFGGVFGAGKREAPTPLQGAGTYAFLHETRNWTAEEICLAYALTEPGVCTALVDAGDVERLSALAATPDRDLPSGLVAQIEMAHFSPAPDRAIGSA